MRGGGAAEWCRWARAGGHAVRGRDLPRAGFVLVREVVTPRWAPFRLGPASLDGLTRRRGTGLVRLLHVGDEPVVVAVSGTVFAARAASEAAAREGLARMRHATGIDDDLAGFHARFRDDPVIGRALRANPELRVRRNPDPWETLMWAITEQLIDMPRAIAIQRRLIGAHGRRFGGAARLAGRAGDRAPRPGRARGLRPARQARAGDDQGRARGGRRPGRLRDADLARLLAIRRSGPGPSRWCTCTGSGASTSCPRAISATSSSSGAS